MNEKTLVDVIKTRREFAERLHKEFCLLSHIDQCSWYYEINGAPDSGWTKKNSEHEVWYNKSAKVLSVFAGYTQDQMISLIHFVKREV